MTHPTNPDGDVTVTDELIDTAALRNHAAKGWDTNCLLPKNTVKLIADEIDRLRTLLSATQTAAVDGEAVVDDLSTLVVRLVRALRKASPDSDLPEKALGYLYRKNLAPSVLRGGAVGEFAAPLDKDASKPVVAQHERGAFEHWYTRGTKRPITAHDRDAITAWDSWQARAMLAASTSANVAQDERGEWFALADGAAASLQNAAVCMTDPDAKRSAEGYAAFVRKRCRELLGSSEQVRLMEWRGSAGLLWDVYAFGKWSKRIVSPIEWDAHTVYLDMVRAGYSEHIEIRLVSASNNANPDEPKAAASTSANVAQGAEHPDDVAVDRFAVAMKEKLAAARSKGRSGWQQCDPTELSVMLREHIEKGDPRDVANFCMFLWSLHQPIAAGNTNDPA